MNILTVIIEKTKNYYSAYAENAEGIYGGGDTPEEAKQSILDGIRILKEQNDADNIPEILKDEYEIQYVNDYLDIEPEDIKNR